MLFLLTFSSLVSEDFWLFLDFLCDRNVFLPSEDCAEKNAIARRESQKTSLVSKEKANKVGAKRSFSEQLSELHRRPSAWRNQFSEQFSDRLPGLAGSQNFSPNSRSVSLLSGVAPANQTKKSQFMNFFQGHSGTEVQCESCLFS